jgi:hypothetical protein
MKIKSKKTGMVLLAIWLILWGLTELIPIFSGLYLVVAILAIIAGIFIFLDR